MAATDPTSLEALSWENSKTYRRTAGLATQLSSAPFIRKLAISQRIGGGFLIILLMTLSLGVIAWVSLNALETSTEELIAELEEVQVGLDMQSQLWQIIEAEMSVLLDPGDTAAYEDFKTRRARFESIWAHWQVMQAAESQAALAEAQEIESIYHDFIDSVDGGLAMAMAGQRDAAIRNEFQVNQPQLARIVQSLGRVALEDQVRQKEIIAAASRATRIANLATALAAVVTIVLGATMSVVVTRTITHPVGELVSATQAFGEGDYSAKATVAPDEIGTLAATFNDMADNLQKTLGALGQRARVIETSGEISRSLSTILDQEQLLIEVVEQVRSAFDYYHVHVYLIDLETGDLMMSGGTGEAGLALLGRGHKISRGRGLVGRAAAFNTVVLVPDVSQEESWLPNELLPDTRSEIAVPIVIGEQVLGVLDVQHDIVNGLDSEDARLLQSVANQVAIALRNARLYEQAQQQASREALINTINRKIRNADSIENVLRTAAAELGQALHAQRASVHLDLAHSDLETNRTNG